MQEKVTEMTLEGGDEKETKTKNQSPADVSLVGGTGIIDDDSDSDDEPAVDMDDFELEEDDPVSKSLS